MNWYKKQLKIAAARRGWTNEELVEIEKLVNQGRSFLSIANMLGVSSHAIDELNKKYQWINHVEERKKKDTFIAGLYLLPPGGKGMTLRRIRSQYKFTRLTIFQALERLNLLDQWRGPEQAAQKRVQDYPELAQDQSIRMKQKIEDMGGFEGMLLNCLTRDKAIAMLNYNVGRIGDENREKAFHVRNKYMKIINNHTFPDEVQQGAMV